MRGTVALFGGILLILGCPAVPDRAQAAPPAESKVREEFRTVAKTNTEAAAELISTVAFNLARADWRITPTAKPGASHRMGKLVKPGELGEEEMRFWMETFNDTELQYLIVLSKNPITAKLFEFDHISQPKLAELGNRIVKAKLPSLVKDPPRATAGPAAPPKEASWLTKQIWRQFPGTRSCVPADLAVGTDRGSSRPPAQ